MLSLSLSLVWLQSCRPYLSLDSHSACANFGSFSLDTWFFTLLIAKSLWFKQASRPFFPVKCSFQPKLSWILIFWYQVWILTLLNNVIGALMLMVQPWTTLAYITTLKNGPMIINYFCLFICHADSQTGFGSAPKRENSLLLKKSWFTFNLGPLFCPANAFKNSMNYNSKRSRTKHHNQSAKIQKMIAPNIADKITIMPKMKAPKIPQYWERYT